LLAKLLPWLHHPLAIMVAATAAVGRGQGSQGMGQYGTGLGRVDHVIHVKAFRRGQGRVIGLHFVGPLLVQRGPLRLIGNGVQFLAVDDIDGAFQSHAAEFGRGQANSKSGSVAADPMT